MLALSTLTCIPELYEAAVSISGRFDLWSTCSSIPAKSKFATMCFRSGNTICFQCNVENNLLVLCHVDLQKNWAPIVGFCRNLFSKMARMYLSQVPNQMVWAWAYYMVSII